MRKRHRKNVNCVMQMSTNGNERVRFEIDERDERIKSNSKIDRVCADVRGCGVHQTMRCVYKLATTTYTHAARAN